MAPFNIRAQLGIGRVGGGCLMTGGAIICVEVTLTFSSTRKLPDEVAARWPVIICIHLDGVNSVGSTFSSRGRYRGVTGVKGWVGRLFGSRSAAVGSKWLKDFMIAWTGLGRGSRKQPLVEVTSLGFICCAVMTVGS